MPIRYVVSDWSGSWVPNRDETPLWKYVGEGLLADAARHVNLYRVGKLALAKRELGKVKAAYARGELDQDAFERAMYATFNARALAGARADAVARLVDGYARQAALTVDARIAVPVLEGLDRGELAGLSVVSGGLTDCIERTLAHYGAGARGIAVHANRFVVTGDRIVRFGTVGGNIYRKKWRRFALATDPQRYDPREVAAIVDDERDLPNIRLADERGVRVVVAFHADGAFKNRMAREHEAVVLEREGDLARFLLRP